jgi:hypothetical protein
MTSSEYNAWAQEQNKKPGAHAQYYLSQPMEGGGTSSVRDPYYSSSEYLNSPDSPYGKPTEDSSLKWSSGSPNDILYGSGGMWSPLTEENLLSDPNALSSFNTQLNTPGAAQGAYTAFQSSLSPETQEAIAALSGSSHNVATEVPGGQAEVDRLLSTMWNPTQPPPPTVPKM